MEQDQEEVLICIIQDIEEEKLVIDKVIVNP